MDRGERERERERERESRDDEAVTKYAPYVLCSVAV